MENYLTVSALTKYIKAKLEGDKHLFSILIKGEISNFKRHSRGHLYFTLKDEGAQLSAIMFSRDASRLLFDPKEGDHVLISGRISVYEPSGIYSIQVSSMKPDGIGELYLKYEALKKRIYRLKKDMRAKYNLQNGIKVSKDLFGAKTNENLLNFVKKLKKAVETNNFDSMKIYFHDCIIPEEIDNIIIDKVLTYNVILEEDKTFKIYVVQYLNDHSPKW